MQKDIWGFLCAISRHWEPLATGLAALAVSAVVGAWWGDHAPWWVWFGIVSGSILIACFLAWRQTQSEKDDNQKQLEILNTPSVSMALHKIDEDLIDSPQTLFIEVTGTSASRIRPELFAVSVEVKNKGRQSLCLKPGIPPSFGLSRGETENVPAVAYYTSGTLELVLPCKKVTSSEYIHGESFSIKVCAYGGPKEAQLEFDIGVTKGVLWAQKPNSTEKLFSDIRHIASGS